MDRDRVIEELIERELAALNARTQGSAAMYERATPLAERRRRVLLPAARPVADLPRSTGEGPRVRDVDGNEYWDFHNGFGSMVQGHAHPAIVEAVRERVALGTHFAAVTEDAIVVAEELQRRFGLAAAGASSTPARRRRWTRSGSPAA